MELEVSKHPLLGPNVKAFYFFGFLQCNNTFRNIFYKFWYISGFLYVITLWIELWFLRSDLNKALENLSISTLAIMSTTKGVTTILWQNYWKKMVENISKQEIKQLNERDKVTTNLMKKYKKYSRIITYFYWFLVSTTISMVISSPFLRYVFLKSHYNEVTNITVQYPEIVSSWYPFDKTNIVIHSVKCLIDAMMLVQGATIIATYDTTVIVIMVFLKGQMKILRENCKTMFREKDTPNHVVINRVKECYEHHQFLMRQHNLLNSMLSPIMFLYMLVSSIMICCSVYQLTLDEATTYQRLWFVEYTIAVVFQLFLYCWHSNEVAVESDSLDRGLYESDWWKADVKIRRIFLLLAGKLNRMFVLEAGPFTTLSVTTFVKIMKGAYSFYTLFTQIQQ
nr:odorant receptor 23 [Achelura yunnanensis]